MKDWVEEQVKDGKYASSSDVVRDLIRRELVKREKTAALNENLAAKQSRSSASAMAARTGLSIGRHARRFPCLCRSHGVMVCLQSRATVRG